MNGRANHLIIGRILSPLFVLLLITLCCIGLVFYIVVADEEYIDLLSTETTFEVDTLPEYPNENDWYELAVRILEGYDKDMSPNLYRITTNVIPCTLNLSLDHLTLEFADSYFAEGYIPSIKYAELTFDRESGIVEVQTSYSPMHWGHSSLELSKTTVDFYEALALADVFKGQEFRESLDNACEISVRLTSNHYWLIAYRENDGEWQNWRIQIDAVTGEVSQYSYP